MSSLHDRILWLDCFGGLIVGAAVLAISVQLSELENLPLRLVLGMGIVNVLYGSYSLFVALQKPRAMRLVETLAIANVAWLIVCVAFVLIWAKQISSFGIFHLLGEGMYVAVLGFIEWRWKDKLGRR